MLRILILILICAPHFLWSQSFKNEADLIKQADEHFEDSQFLQALPMFSQLVSLSPQSAEYNFKFGTCVIYSGVDRETAIRHLSFATKKNVSDPRAYYYLGLAQHLNYEFREAKKSYGTFVQKADEKLRENFDAQRQIEMCTNGEGLLSSITDLVVLDKKEVSENDFFRYYTLDEIGGKVIAKPEVLITKNDKKKGLKGVVHFDRNSDYIFYSSYGASGDQLDLYRVQPLADGKFSKAEKLKGKVNSQFDEDFAFLHADGETLYFASKGHSSMGGYDVFKAMYDINTDEYNSVENLDFAVNTPDDDLFYLVDSTKTMAYFASGRSSALNNLHVYKVRVDAVPVNLVIIQGDFISQINENQKNTKINIIDEFTGMPIGEFYTDKSTGDYMIPFERAGKYKFEVEVENSPLIHEGIVEIPSFGNPVVLRQELILSKTDGIERLEINNFFDELVDTDIAALTQDILRRKAGLEVNADQMTALLEQEQQKQENEEPVEELDNSRPVSDAGVVAGFNEEMSVADISTEMKATADEYHAKAEMLSSRSKEAYAESQQRKGIANDKFEQGKVLLASADESNPEGYIRQTNEANVLLAESKKLNQEAQSLLELVRAVDTYSQELEATSNGLKTNAAIVDQSASFDEVVVILKTEKERQRSVSKEDASNPENVISTAANFTDNELKNLVSRIDGLREEEKSLELKISGKKRTLEATSKNSEKETIETEIQALENELITTKEDLEDESGKVESLSYDAENYALQREYLEQLNQADFAYSNGSLDYSTESLSGEIANVKTSALEAQALIPTDVEQIASASEEQKSRIELKTLENKLRELPSGLELKGLTAIREEYNLKRNSMASIDNQAAEMAREDALAHVYEKDLETQQYAIKAALEVEGLSDEEVALLEEEKSAIQNEIDQSRASRNDVLGAAVTEAEIEETITKYAAESMKELTAWENETASFNGLSDAEFMAMQAQDDLGDEIRAKQNKIATSSSADEILELSKEIEVLEKSKKYLANKTSDVEFLSEVYNAEKERNPDDELGVSKQYRTVLEQKVIQLDEANNTASPLAKAANQELKVKLSNELTALGGRISNLENVALVNAELAAENASASTGDENGESGSSSEGTEAAEEVVLSYESSEEIMDWVSPNYNGITQSIISNPVSTEAETLTARQFLNEEAIENVKNQIADRVDLLDTVEEESEKDELQTQINSLQQLKSELETENESFATRIETLESGETIADNAETANAETNTGENGSEENPSSPAVGIEEVNQTANTSEENSETIAENGETQIEAAVENAVTGENGSEENQSLSAEATEAANQTANTSEEASETIAENGENLIDSAVENGTETTTSEVEASAENRGSETENGTNTEETENTNSEAAESAVENALENEALETENTETLSETGETNDNGESVATAENATENSSSESLSTEVGTKAEGETTAAEGESEENENATEITNPVFEDLTTEEIQAEVETLPAVVKSDFNEQITISEEIEIDELAYSDTYEDIIENNPEVSRKLKNQAQIQSLTSNIEQFENTDTETEKQAKKLERKIGKFEKKRAKMEVKNAPYIADAASEEYTESLSEVDEYIIQNETKLSESAPLLQQVQKLRAAAVVYNEDAEIYKGLAESSNKDIVKQSELYKESAAKQVAAIENLEKVEWLLDNSESLAELSPETFRAMTEDQALIQQSLAIDNTEVAENSINTTIADRVLMLEDSVLMSDDLSQNWELTPEELAVVKRAPAFVDYEIKTDQLSENVEELVRLESELQSTQTEAKNLEDQAVELEAKIELTESETEKEEIRTEVKRMRAAAVIAYEKADELETSSEELLTESTRLKYEIISLQSHFSPEALLAEGNMVEAAEVASVASTSMDAETLYSKSLDLSSAVNETIFSKTKNVYSETRPIPVGIKLPEGLVYKVQVGAFRNPISQTLYNDFAPVAGEKLNNGITRYTAGIFTAESVANDAKKDIRGIGFSDAFVVAYMNGERISLTEARNLGLDRESETNSSFALENTTEPVSQAGGTNVTPDTPQNTAIGEPIAGNQPSTNTEETPVKAAPSDSFNPTESSDDYYESFPDAAEANQIEVLSGLFYTVQVGVYSKPVPAKDILNISPLNSERLTNNNIRYTTGIYNNLEEAVRRKEQIQSVGIVDAFVTAYFNGKRITVSAAKVKFTEEGIEVLEVSNQVADSRSIGSEAAVQKEYVIYIGTFTDEVPANIAKAMLFLEESRGIVQKKNGSEVSYYTKAVKSESTAKIIKQEFESYEVFSTQIQEVE